MKLEQLGSDNQDDYLHTGEDLLESARLLMEYHKAKRHADLYARAVRIYTFLEVGK